MNVLRFTGKDSRSALEQVRQQLGPEALILSNRRTPAGVEICAATELPDLSGAGPAPTAAGGGQNEIQLAQLKRELASLRETLQSALGERRWQDTAEQRPIQATVAQRLVTLGIGRVLAGELTSGLAPNESLDRAWQNTLNALTARMESLSEEEFAGFRIKFVIGASGSGKTRGALALLKGALDRHGADRVAVIDCADTQFRSPITEAAMNRGLKVLSARDRQSLSVALAECRWAREVIVDTPGLNPALGSQDPAMSLLSGHRAGAVAFLVLPATGQAEHLRQIVEHAAGLPLAGAIVSKVDEAVSIGAIMDVVVGQNLPLAGRVRVDTGQLVPLTGRELVTNAKRLAKRAMQARAAQLKVAV